MTGYYGPKKQKSASDTCRIQSAFALCVAVYTKIKYCQELFKKNLKNRSGRSDCRKIGRVDKSCPFIII